MLQQIEEHLKLVQEIDVQKLQEIGAMIKDKLSQNAKVLIFGNGGSAADAQHFAAELIGRFVKERKSLAAIALTTDTSIITAVANDYGYTKIFSRQLEGLLKPNDVVIAISTSGNSENVISAIRYANTVTDVTVITMTGNIPNKAQQLADYSLYVNSSNVARIQEVHELMLHLIAEKIEE